MDVEDVGAEDDWKLEDEQYGRMSSWRGKET